MSERDELARILHDEAAWYGLDASGYGGHLERAADAILAAGYRKPRTITTAEEVEKLPVESLAFSSGQVWIRETLDAEGYSWRSITGIWNLRKPGDMLPATIVHTPEPSA